MLREIRASDLPDVLRLVQANFPEENALLGWDPPAFERAARRFFRWDTRLLLGLLRLVGRPIFRMFLLERDGHPVAAALLTYAARSGYVSTVVVDPAFRRQGYARAILAACRTATARSGRRYVVLDVLDANAPARALYASLGFHSLLATTYLARAIDGAPAPVSDRVRPFRSRDAPPLVEVELAQRPGPVQDVLPFDRGQLAVPSRVVAGLGSETAAWVTPADGPPGGWIRATTSGFMAAANLTRPILAPDLAEADVDALLATATGWIAARGKRRAVVEVPEYDLRGRAALERAGFGAQFGVGTQVLDLGP